MDERLNSFDPAARREALEEFADGNTRFNMHCHSFFSYSGYGFSPSALAVLAKQENWRAAGMVDFDVLDGVDEFLSAAQRLGVRAVAGLEPRVFIPELKDVEINSPGEPGVAYHLGYGFSSSTVPEGARAFLKSLREKASARIRRQIEQVNALLLETPLDAGKVAAEFTPGGNLTERHLCMAYRIAAERVFPEVEERRAYWMEKIGIWDADPVVLEGLIRAKTMKRGGVGYIQAEASSFPTLEEMNRFVVSCGAVPTVAWLNGLSAGEKDPGRLLDLHCRAGAGAVTLIPDRNWNVPDPGIRTLLTDAMDSFINACMERKLPVLAGTEMNAPGQKLADDFTVPALAPYLGVFTAGADALAK